MMCKFPVYDFENYWYWNTNAKGTDIERYQNFIGSYLCFFFFQRLGKTYAPYDKWEIVAKVLPWFLV